MLTQLKGDQPTTSQQHCHGPVDLTSRLLKDSCDSAVCFTKTTPCSDRLAVTTWSLSPDDKAGGARLDQLTAPFCLTLSII